MNIKEFRKKYPQYSEVPDRQLTEALYEKHYKDKVGKDDFISLFTKDTDKGTFFTAVSAQNETRRIFDDIAKTPEGSTERAELLKDLQYYGRVQESNLTDFSDSPLKFAGEQVALGFKSFLGGAAAGGAAGAAAGSAAGGIGAIPGAAIGSTIGGLVNVAYDSYNIWQAENLLRSYENDEDGAISDEQIKEARETAIAQAGIETAFSAIPVGGALTKAFGKPVTGVILKEGAKAALVGGATEATAAGLNQSLQRSILDGVEVFDQEGVKEIASTAGAAFIFGSALGGTLDVTANTAKSVLKNSKESTIDPARQIDEEFESVGGTTAKPKKTEDSVNEGDYSAKKNLREDILKANLNEENAETFKKYNAERSEAGAEAQARLEGLYTNPEQRLRLRRLPENKVLEADKKLQDEGVYDDFDAQNLRLVKKSAVKNPPNESEFDLKYIEDEDLVAEQTLASLDFLDTNKRVAGLPKNARKFLASTALSALGAGRRNPYRAKATHIFKNIEDTTEGLTFRKLSNSRKLGVADLYEKDPIRFGDVHQKIADFRVSKGYKDENGNYRYKDENGVEQVLKPEDAKLAESITEYYKTDIKDARNLTLVRLKNLDHTITNLSTAKRALKNLEPDTDRAKKLESEIEILENFEESLADPLYVPFKRFGNFVGTKVGDGFYTVEVKDNITDRVNNLNNYVFDEGAISKAEYKDLRQRVLHEQGIDIGEKPSISQVTPRGRDGKIIEGQFFRPSKDNLANLSDKSILAALETELEGISPEAAKFAKNLGDIKKLSQLRKAFRQSRNILGYSKDWDRVYRDSLHGRSYILARYLHEPGLDKLKQIGDETTRKYIDYVQEGDTATVPLRVASAVAAFGANVSTAALNLTTALTTGPMAMGIYTGNYAGQVAKIYPKMTKTLRLWRFKDSAESLSVQNLTKVLGSKKRAEQARRNASVLFQNTTMELKTKTISSRDQFKKVSNEAADMAFAFMRNTELTSRLTLWETALDDLETIRNKNPQKFQSIVKRASKDENLKSALEARGTRTEEEVLANYVVERAHGLYGAHGRSYYQRGVGSIIAPFTTYVQNAFELYIDSQFDVGDPKRIAQALGVSATMGMLFGIQGIPLYQIAEPIWAAYDKLINGKNYGMTRNDVIKTLQDNGVPDETINFIVNGFVGEHGNVDISSRVGVGNPYSSMIKLIANREIKDVGFLGGVLDNVMSDPSNPEAYINNITAVKNMVNAGQQLAGKEGYVTSRGETVIPANELKTTDIILQAGGWRPMSFTEAQSIKQAERNDQPSRYAEWEDNKDKQAFKAYTKYVETGDRKYLDKVEDAWEDIVKRYEREGHENFITREKQEAFWERLIMMQYNKETGASITPPSKKEQIQGERVRRVYDPDQ